MAKRSFLIPVAVALAALVSPSQASIPAPHSQSSDSKHVMGALPGPAAGGEEVFYQAGADLFSFVLSTSTSGEVYAQHSSHSSHASHASHRSHYSSR